METPGNLSRKPPIGLCTAKAQLSTPWQVSARYCCAETTPGEYLHIESSPQGPSAVRFDRLSTEDRPPHPKQILPYYRLRVWLQNVVKKECRVMKRPEGLHFPNQNRSSHSCILKLGITTMMPLKLTCSRSAELHSKLTLCCQILNEVINPIGARTPF